MKIVLLIIINEKYLTDAYGCFEVLIMCKIMVNLEHLDDWYYGLVWPSSAQTYLGLGLSVIPDPDLHCANGTTVLKIILGEKINKL